MGCPAHAVVVDAIVAPGAGVPEQEGPSAYEKLPKNPPV